MTRQETPRESAIVKTIVQGLREAFPGILVLKYHGGPHSVAGHPDLYGCYLGHAFAIEVKRPGGRPTALQSARLAEWAAAGAITGVATSLDDARAIIERGVEWLDPE